MIYVVWYRHESGRWYALSKHYVRLAVAKHRGCLALVVCEEQKVDSGSAKGIMGAISFEEVSGGDHKCGRDSLLLQVREENDAILHTLWGGRM